MELELDVGALSVVTITIQIVEHGAWNLDDGRRQLEPSLLEPGPSRIGATVKCCVEPPINVVWRRHFCLGTVEDFYRPMVESSFAAGRFYRQRCLHRQPNSLLDRWRCFSPPAVFFWLPVGVFDSKKLPDITLCANI